MHGHCVCRIHKPSCSVDENRTPRLLRAYSLDRIITIKTVTSDLHARADHMADTSLDQPQAGLDACDHKDSRVYSCSYTRASHVSL